MPNYHRHRRDDFDYEDQERYSRNGGGRQSRSSYRPRDEGSGSQSRSRSQSVERHNRHRHHDSYSRSRSRSRSRSNGYTGGRRAIRYGSRRNRDSRSRSRSPVVHGGRSQQTHRRSSRSPGRTHDRYRRSRSRNSSEKRNDKWYESRRGDNAHSMLNESNASSSTSSTGNMPMHNSYNGINLDNLPLPKRDARGNYYHLDVDEPFDKERIHREMEEKLRAALAKEGKVYPPPKPEASHPVFANDGSFIEIFKKMQEAQKQHPTAQSSTPAPAIVVASTSASASVGSNASKTAPPAPPLVGRRRGGKILKTGVVAKPKAQQETNADPKDFWSLYLAEVNKYKNNACESDGGTRPLVK